MRISHLGHAAVLVEIADARILIDPGNFDPRWHDLTGLDAILVTHQHPDHLEPEHAPALVAANPGAAVLVEPSIVDRAGREGLPQLDHAQPMAAGESRTVAGVTIRAVGGEHAIIHRDIPRVGNVGFVIGAAGEPTVFHPGDSYDTAPEDVDIVGVPLFGPWGATKEAIDFARAVGAPRGFPIHDGLLADRGRKLIMSQLGQMSPTEMIDIRDDGPRSF